MVIRKRNLLWDWTCTKSFPKKIDLIPFTPNSPFHSVSNWNTWYPTELKSRAPFRPTVRLEAQLSGQDWQNVLNTKEAVVHFFNEPERAGISAQHAADLWNKQMIPLRKTKGKILVSPSCSNDGAGQAWIADWMNRVIAAGNAPDYLGLHYYGTKSNEAISFIESMHKKFPKQKVIVSEIACISRDYKEVLKFTVEVTNWMDSKDWVAEYSWFGCMPHLADNFVSPAAQLMKEDGSFTDLMKKLMTEQPMKM